MHLQKNNELMKKIKKKIKIYKEKKRRVLWTSHPLIHLIHLTQPGEVILPNIFLKQLQLHQKSRSTRRARAGAVLGGAEAQTGPIFIHTHAASLFHPLFSYSPELFLPQSALSLPVGNRGSGPHGDPSCSRWSASGARSLLLPQLVRVAFKARATGTRSGARWRRTAPGGGTTQAKCDGCPCPRSCPSEPPRCSGRPTAIWFWRMG